MSVETGHDVSDLRVAWRLEHLRRKKHAQSAEMRHDELMHLAIGCRPGQHRQQTEHQDLRQRIQFSRRAPMVSDLGKNLQQCRLRQSGPS
jgi:flagellar biosynthesis component FlhA